MTKIYPTDMKNTRFKKKRKSTSNDLKKFIQLCFYL